MWRYQHNATSMINLCRFRHIAQIQEVVWMKCVWCEVKSTHLDMIDAKPQEASWISVHQQRLLIWENAHGTIYQFRHLDFQSFINLSDGSRLTLKSYVSVTGSRFNKDLPRSCDLVTVVTNNVVKPQQFLSLSLSSTLYSESCFISLSLYILILSFSILLSFIPFQSCDMVQRLTNKKPIWRIPGSCVVRASWALWTTGDSQSPMYFGLDNLNKGRDGHCTHFSTFQKITPA